MAWDSRVILGAFLPIDYHGVNPQQPEVRCEYCDDCNRLIHRDGIFLCRVHKFMWEAA